MSKLSKKDVEHIARLSKLKLTEAEVDRFANQLSCVLKYVDQLNQVDTSGVEPMSQITGLSNRFRGDKFEKSKINYEDIKKNAPDFKKGSFKVPGVFEN